jgi:wobble nucleotide-excising tRNase
MSYSFLQEVLNCGFHSWIDPEWPGTLKNALAKIWAKYDDCTSARRHERIENAKFVKELCDEKNKVESKYSSLIAAVNKHMDETAGRVIQQNHARIMGNNEEEKRGVDVLKNEVAMLKQLNKTQVDIMINNETKWNDERASLKEEIEKLECVIRDLFNAGAANSDKLRRTKAICDE